MKYILEPLLFAFDENTSEDELVEYLCELINLDDWWNKHKDEMYVLSDMGDVLCVNGYYPYVDNLKPLLDKYGIDFISYKDVSKLLDKYMNKSNYIDQLCEEEMIGMQERNVIDPSEFDTSRRPEVLHDEFMKLLWYVFCLRLIKGDDEDAYVVIAKHISEAVKIEFKYEAIENVEGKETIVVHDGKSEINCKASLTDFLKDAKTPFLLWKMAEKREDLDLGLRVSVYQTNGLSSLDDAFDGYDFSVQDSFYQDYCDNRYAERPSDIVSAIDSVTKVINDIRHGKEHNMRTGPGGANPYVFHDDYAGMRKNVTTSIKLHYWKKKPSYKFAKIGEHDFFDIPWED